MVYFTGKREMFICCGARKSKYLFLDFFFFSLMCVCVCVYENTYQNIKPSVLSKEYTVMKENKEIDPSGRFNSEPAAIHSKRILDASL